MTKLVIGLVVLALGLLLIGGGVLMILHQWTYTETAMGTVVRRAGQEIVVRFHAERSSPAPQEMHFFACAEYAFPVDDHTANLVEGNRVFGFYPPGHLEKVRLARDFANPLPGAMMAAGFVLNLLSIGLFWMARRRSTE
jgi:hypothetical protein